MSRRLFTYMAATFMVFFTFTNCNNESLFDSPSDPTCGRTISFIVEVSPAGAGSVTKSVYVDAEGLNGLMPFQVVKFFAIPQEGYRFIKWDLDPLVDREENPVYLVPCNISTYVKTVNVAAIFEGVME